MLARAPGQLGTGRGPARKIEWRAGAAICIMCVCMHFYTRQRACPQASTNGLSRCSRLISSGHVSAASGGPAPGASRTAGKEAWEGEHLAPARGACAWESTCSTWRWVFFPFVPARDVVVRRGACGCRVRSSPLGHAHLGHRPARQRLVPLVLGLFFFFCLGLVLLLEDRPYTCYTRQPRLKITVHQSAMRARHLSSLICLVLRRKEA